VDALRPPEEAARLASLHSLGILDTPPEERFDRITRVAATLFHAPLSFVSLIDDERQWLKSCFGTEGALEWPRELSVCAHTILSGQPLVIPDLSADARFAANPVVAGPPHLRFYAGHPLRAPDGHRIGTVCVVDVEPREVTPAEEASLADLAAWAEGELGGAEQATALRQVQAAEARIRVIMDTVAEGIVTFGEDGHVTGANPAAERAFGVGAGGLTGRPIATLVSDLGWAEIREALGRSGALDGAAVTGRRRSMTGARADGSEFPLELAISDAVIDGERLFIAAGQDVSARQATEEALRASERRFRAVFDHAALGIGLIRPDGTFLDVNRALRDMLGYGPGELLLGVWSRDLVHPEDRDEQPIEDLVLGRITRYRSERRYLRRDGSIMWGALTASLLRDDDGNPELVVAVIDDISRRKEVERLKDEFVSVVGHELRTPLTSIRGSLGLLAAGVSGELPEEVKGMVELAVSNTDRLVRLVNDALDFERIQAGRAQIEASPTPAAELVAVAVDVVAAVASEAGVTLREEVGDLTAMADRDRIVQALTNLLGNAVKYSPPGGEVVLSVEPADGEVVFSVRDQGRGIPPDQLEAIFERFRQVDASDAREKGGTGLGLAIARGIVERHGGRIWAESAPGHGATFRFTLPFADGGR
jgi:PAS domain S-box-containing protein